MASPSWERAFLDESARHFSLPQNQISRLEELALNLGIMVAGNPSSVCSYAYGRALTYFFYQI